MPEIETPVLITCGRCDELRPACADTLKAGIKGAELQIFENSAHVAHIEKRKLIWLAWAIPEKA